MKKHIPNLLTLLNLFSGLIAILFVFEQQWTKVAFFVCLGIFFDFFDGFAARKLKVQSELGLQLDSLADMVTSGVVPGLIMFYLIGNSLNTWDHHLHIDNLSSASNLGLFGLLVTLGSCYRLANFNIDERQTDSFIGLPTPANTLLIISLPLILIYSDIEFITDLLTNTWFLISLSILSVILLNMNVGLFALKFKNFGFKENAVKYVFLLCSVVAIFLLHFLAIPLIIISYILLSLVIKK